MSEQGDEGIFNCENCGHKPTPQEVLDHHGDCAKCHDIVIAYTIDAAEYIIQLKAQLAEAEKRGMERAIEVAEDHDCATYAECCDCGAKIASAIRTEMEKLC